MRRRSGQAALGVAMVLHWLITLAITLAVLGGVGLAAFAWRLSQGPVDLGWFTGRLVDSLNANGGPTRLTIGSVALAWEGFRMGVDQPLDLRLNHITLIDVSGGQHMTIPRADVSISLYELLFGRIVPRGVVLDAPQLTFLRAEDGNLRLDLGSLTAATDSSEPVATGRATPVADLLSELARPPTSDRARGRDALLGQLQIMRVRDARVILIDRQLGITLRAPKADIELARRPRGGVNGSADFSLALGDQQAQLMLSATLTAGASETHLRAMFSPVTPSVVARVAPSLAALAALNAAVGGEASLDLDSSLALREARVSLRVSSGDMHISDGDVPFLGATLVASGTPELLTLQALRLRLPGHDNGPPTLLESHGTLRRSSSQINAVLSVNFDQANFADLARLWPQGAATHARAWLLENVPVGTARNAHVDLGLSASADLSRVDLTRASGALDAEGLQVHWLRPVPPIDNGQAHLRIIDPNTLEIGITGGHERLANQATGLQIRSGRMLITGIMRPHQTGIIEADITGPLPDALALLREPRLGLLDRHPIELKNPSGQALVKLSMTVPLERSVQMEDIGIQTQAHLESVHLGGLVAGRDLDQGTFDLTANPEGMKLTGSASLAAIPAKFDATMDFRSGPPNQVLQSVTIEARPDASQLAAAGLDTTSVLNGAPQVQAVLNERRNGQGEVTVSADLTSAELVVPPLEWRKPRNALAKASAHIGLDHDRLTSIDGVQVDGDGLVIRGHGKLSAGRLETFQVDRVALGRSDAQGTVDVPASGPIRVNLNGPTLDLAPRLGRRASERASTPSPTEPPPGRPWVLDAKFSRVLMAQGSIASDVVVHAENDGRVVRQLRIDGRTGSRAPFLAQIVPDHAGRRFTGNTDDAGALLRGLDYVRSMQGGKASVEGRFDDAQPGRPLTGTATIEDFRVRDAPALAKLLQAMTLYGLAQVMQGPGLGFTRLVVPFRLTDDALDVTDARAFNPSLGLTMKGRLDLDAQRIKMQGTIVPAYFFNSMLGNIPLVGKLFSPERGGGLVAASYTLRGRVEDPDVFINPLTTLTPGFLRGLFGLF